MTKLRSHTLERYWKFCVGLVLHAVWRPLCAEKLRLSSLLVPVGFRVAIQSREHDGQNLRCIVADQTHDVLIVPIVQSSLCHLKKTTQYLTVRQTLKSCFYFL